MIRIHDIKLDALEDLIEGTNGKPVLIAYWYKSYLRRIKYKFDVRELKTNEDFKKWNQGKIPVAITYVSIGNCQGTMYLQSIFDCLKN